MAQPTGGIGNVITNPGLVEMAMAYSRSRILLAAARLGIADALGDEIRSIDFLAEKCQADPDALYRLLRALASIGVTEETTPEHFRLTPFGQPLRKDAPHSVWAAVIFWADLLADDWSLLTDCVRTGKPASQVRDSNIPSRWSQEPDASSIFRAVMRPQKITRQSPLPGTFPTRRWSPISAAAVVLSFLPYWDSTRMYEACWSTSNPASMRPKLASRRKIDPSDAT